MAISKRGARGRITVTTGTTGKLGEWVGVVTIIPVVTTRKGGVVTIVPVVRAS